MELLIDPINLKLQIEGVESSEQLDSSDFILYVHHQQSVPY